jgi:hypothetical protein
MVAVLTTRWMGRMLQRKAVNDNVMELQETVKSQDGYNPKRTGCTKSDLWHCKDVMLKCLRPWNSSTWCILMRHLRRIRCTLLNRPCSSSGPPIQGRNISRSLRFLHAYPMTYLFGRNEGRHLCVDVHEGSGLR